MDNELNDFRLPCVKNLVNTLNTNNILYCHFKSNEHVVPAVQGDTDLDILFEDDQIDLVECVLKNCGFIKFKAVGRKKYSYIEDYICIDKSTGKLVHVHGHYRLLSGVAGIKPHVIPWEHRVLSNRIWCYKSGIYISGHVDELYLLLIRSALKHFNFNLTSKVSSRIFKNELPIDLFIEFDWLRARVGLDK